MQMSNGWSFSFAGNVNAFFIYSSGKACNAAEVCVTASKDLSVGTGLLPAFAVFDAKGKEENLDLGVHFGFAPQVEFGGHNASYFGTDAAGAQIDMREVFLTAGGGWGTLTMGKALGVFLRGNILTDMTLLGVGVGGGGRGTALGRIGYGYLYTDFRPQLTYSTAGGKASSLMIGLFEGIRYGPYTVLELPRVEAEFSYNTKPGEGKDLKFFVNGAVQTAKDGVTDASSLSSTGVGGGVSFGVAGFGILASGFYADGMGFLLSGDGIVGGGNFNNLGVDAAGEGRTSYGYIGQATYGPPGGKFMIGASYGENILQASSADVITEDLVKNRAIIGQITYKWSKSLRWVAEYGHIEGFSGGVKTSKSDQASVGMMLFF
jgi:hypothetical protein